MSRALRVFTVTDGVIVLRVRLLPSIADVDAAYREGQRRRAGEIVHAYFQPARSTAARHDGTVVLGMDGNLDELVPHEVTHAVIHFMRGVSANDDEAAATAVGMLSALILAKARRTA